MPSDRKSAKSPKSDSKAKTAATPAPDEPTPAEEVPPAPLAYQSLLPHPTPSERIARGKVARQDAPRSSQAAWSTWPERPDPIGILETQAATRMIDLVPIRYGRMASSPFAFFRGGAAIMASDLAATTRTGLRVQTCGDAHLVNFGIFAAPERSLIFDINDFDETLPGPWEWDIKRLAASFEVSMRDRGFDKASRRNALLAGVKSYRDAMAEFSEMTNLEVWYARLGVEDMQAELAALNANKQAKIITKSVDKAQFKNNLGALDKLTVMVDGEPRIVSEPPLIVPAAELLHGEELDRFTDTIHSFLRSYALSLPDDRRHLLESYEFKQIARKVVGVGSVGMRSWIVLTVGRDTSDPLFLQLKQAEESVLERFVGRSRYRNHGRRVVEGQRLMQAASDIILGWYKVLAFDGKWHDFYVRQLWDGKASFDMTRLPEAAFASYARACFWTLARAHARTGDRIAISAYLGPNDLFDNAIADFAYIYALQNELDHQALLAAIKSGRVEARMGI